MLNERQFPALTAKPGSVESLGPRWADSFGDEPVVGLALMAKKQGRTPRQANVFRGETRKVYPTPEYPDPARAAKEDPNGLARHWGSGNHPWPPDNPLGYGLSNADGTYSPMNPVSTGVHWTESPQAIPERFTEALLNGTQPGSPLTPDEIRNIGEEETYQLAEDGGTLEPDMYALRGKVNRRRDAGTQAYRDLSHRDTGREPYRMAVVHHGKIDASMIDRNSRTTDYEDEVNLKEGAEVPVHAQQIYVPPAGKPAKRGGVTPDIVRRHGVTSMEHGLGVVSNRSAVPWSVAEFADGENSIPISRSRPSFGQL